MGLCCSRCCPCCQPEKVDRSTSTSQKSERRRGSKLKLKEVGLSKIDQSQLIRDYEKEKLLPLEDALQDFRGHITHLDHQITDAKRDCHFPSEHGLTKDESAAIHLFTKTQDSNGVYHHLQDALNSNIPSQVKKLAKIFEVIKNCNR